MGFFNAGLLADGDRRRAGIAIVRRLQRRYRCDAVVAASDSAKELLGCLAMRMPRNDTGQARVLLVDTAVATCVGLGREMRIVLRNDQWPVAAVTFFDAAGDAAERCASFGLDLELVSV